MCVIISKLAMKILQVMPQFNPLWWINLVSWTFAILAFTTWYHQTISFPYTIRVQLTRAFISYLLAEMKMLLLLFY